MKAPDRFYGDPVECFRAMADGASGPVDEAHFRMWCRVAATELAYARHLVEMGADKLTAFMGRCAEAEHDRDRLRSDLDALKAEPSGNEVPK